MKKSYILDIYNSENTVFTFKDISLIWGETNTDLIKRRTYRYVKSGKLYSIRKGIYARDKDYNKFELATKIYTPSYISLETVLTQEGVVFQYCKDISVVSYLSRKIISDNQAYVYKKIKNKVLINSLGVEVRDSHYIATKERAFMDMLYFYKNYHFDNLESIDWNKCFKLLPIYENKAMETRLNSYYKNYA